MSCPGPRANLRRLQRHALLTPAPSGTDPAEIAAVICGAQAQVLSRPNSRWRWALGGHSDDGPTRAVEGTQLIKTFGPRGTVHLLATDDLRMWMAALSAIPAHSCHGRWARLAATV
jgi:hypothetical protein